MPFFPYPRIVVIDPTTVHPFSTIGHGREALPPHPQTKQTNQQHAGSAGLAERHTAVTVWFT